MKLKKSAPLSHPHYTNGDFGESPQQKLGSFCGKQQIPCQVCGGCKESLQGRMAEQRKLFFTEGILAAPPPGEDDQLRYGKAGRGKTSSYSIQT